jgi:hypothetical protein
VICVSRSKVAGYDQDMTHGNAVPRENPRSRACVQVAYIQLQLYITVC